MPKSTTAKFIVSVDVPPGMSVADLEEYVRQAVKTWKGYFMAGDPRSGIKPKSVKVKPLDKVLQKFQEQLDNMEERLRLIQDANPKVG